MALGVHFRIALVLCAPLNRGAHVNGVGVEDYSEHFDSGLRSTPLPARSGHTFHMHYALRHIGGKPIARRNK